MNTLSDTIAFNREHASRHVDKSFRGWWRAGIVIALCFVLSVLYLKLWVPHSAAQHENGLGATVNTR